MGKKNTNMKTNTLNNLNVDLILESADLLEEGLQRHEGVGFGGSGEQREDNCASFPSSSAPEDVKFGGVGAQGLCSCPSHT